MSECPHGSSMPDELIRGLQDSQAAAGRHKCVVCAYGKGAVYTEFGTGTESCGHGGIAPSHVLEALPVYQGGLGRHKCATCAFTEGVGGGAAIPDQDTVEIVDQGAQEGPGSIEGTPRWRVHRTYERSSRNRARAILLHGNRCLACGFSFDAVYTHKHAKGFIEVHHRRPLSEGPRAIDPAEDLIPLCSNCHRMVHRRGDDWLDLEELRRLMTEASEAAGNGDA